MTIETFPKTISSRWLLSIHLISPALLLVFFVDVTFFKASLLPYMGMDTLLLPVYVLIFELPHIIASLLTFADKTYVRFYKKHLLIGLPTVLIVVGIFFYLNPKLTFLVYIIATMYHVIRQQTGIASILSKTKGVWFSIWTMTMILITATMLAIVAMPSLFSSTQVSQLSLVVLFCVCFSLIATGFYLWCAKTTIGRWYILATAAVVITSYFFTLVGYIFFAFLVLRFVHDITAFTFYIVHDINRNLVTIQNNFYALFKKIRIPFFILVPLASILIALLIRTGVSKTSIAVAVIVLIGFAHYYVEAIMWRRDSPHRQQISFSK